MAYEKNEDELGCLWEKSGAKGPYFTGTIEIDGTKHAIVVFKNGNKRSEKAPDWRILKSQKREQPAVQISSEDVPFMWALPLLLPAMLSVLRLVLA